MSEPTSSASATGGAPSGATMTEHPASPYDGPPVWTPGDTPPGNVAASVPAPPATRLRDRVLKIWHALAVGAACLVVGLGFGVLIGHETGGSGSDVFQQPTFGQGPGGHGPGGQGSGGQGFGGQGLGGQGTSGSGTSS